MINYALTKMTYSTHGAHLIRGHIVKSWIIFLLPAPHGVRVMWVGGGGDLSPTLSVITNWTGKKYQCSKVSNNERIPGAHRGGVCWSPPTTPASTPATCPAHIIYSSSRERSPRGNRCSTGVQYRLSLPRCQLEKNMRFV